MAISIANCSISLVFFPDGLHKAQSCHNMATTKVEQNRRSHADGAAAIAAVRLNALMDIRFFDDQFRDANWS
jgi:hypothetical protein